MPITINGDGTITGLAEGGLEDAKIIEDDIKAKAVAVSKLKDGTDGELITWNASGVAETVAVGTSGHYLKSNGAGAKPSWAAAGGATINNATENELVTVASTTTQLDAESGLTFDGTHLTIGDGNLVIGTSGHGIDFSATADTAASNASMGNELLSDYEYGTWTPSLDGGTYTSSNPSIVATYVKIGHFVFANAAYKNVSQFTSTANSTHFDDVPFNSNDQAAGSAVQANIGDLGSICVNGSTWYLPAVNYTNNVNFTCVYNV